jgi:hypothetical protein
MPHHKFIQDQHPVMLIFEIRSADLLIFKSEHAAALQHNDCFSSFFQYDCIPCYKKLGLNSNEYFAKSASASRDWSCHMTKSLHHVK